MTWFRCKRRGGLRGVNAVLEVPTLCVRHSSVCSFIVLTPRLTFGKGTKCFLAPFVVFPRLGKISNGAGKWRGLRHLEELFWGNKKEKTARLRHLLFKCGAKIVHLCVRGKCNCCKSLNTDAVFKCFGTDGVSVLMARIGLVHRYS